MNLDNKSQKDAEGQNMDNLKSEPQQEDTQGDYESRTEFKQKVYDEKDEIVQEEFKLFSKKPSKQTLDELEE